jgi:glycosyltransferase involved in cell wall biosynthesis
MASNAPRVLLVISARRSAPKDNAPRKDYDVLAEQLNATISHRGEIDSSRSARMVRKIAGSAVAQAWIAFRRRKSFDVIVTDGEHIGIPLGMLLKLSGDRTAHVTIGHRLTASKKRPFFRWLRVQTHITRFAVHARRQLDLAIRELEIPSEQLAFVPYQVDTQFWQPRGGEEERLICSAGLEFRDYPTLVEAVDGLDVRVVIGAASHWSKRRNTAENAQQRSNMEVAAFDYAALRDVYARSAIVVVPLDDTDFQAGVTTILEAMSMGKPVIVTHSQGQTDVVEDRRSITRGKAPRTRPSSLLRNVAAAAGVDLEPTGFYVPPNEPEALRNAIVYLLDHPEERQRLGLAGRRMVEQLMTVEQFAQRLSELVVDAHTATVSRSMPRREAAIDLSRA